MTTNEAVGFSTSAADDGSETTDGRTETVRSDRRDPDRGAEAHPEQVPIGVGHEGTLNEGKCGAFFVSLEEGGGSEASPLRTPNMKREKSHSELSERKKKRVKFSVTEDSDEVVVATCVFERGAQPPQGDPLTARLRRFLRKRSRRPKSSAETQTDVSDHLGGGVGETSDDAVHSAKKCRKIEDVGDATKEEENMNKVAKIKEEKECSEESSKNEHFEEEKNLSLSGVDGKAAESVNEDPLIRREGTFTLEGSSFETKSKTESEVTLGPGQTADKRPCGGPDQTADKRPCGGDKSLPHETPEKATDSSSDDKDNTGQLAVEGDGKRKAGGSSVRNYRPARSPGAAARFMNAMKTALHQKSEAKAAPSKHLADSFGGNTKSGRVHLTPKDNNAARKSNSTRLTAPPIAAESRARLCRGNRNAKGNEEDEEEVLRPAERSPRNQGWLKTPFSFRRDGTFTKFDAEKTRLSQEVQKLTTDKERLEMELSECRWRLEEEVASRRAVRRCHEQQMRQAREEEAKRTEAFLVDVRNRLEDEKAAALQKQKEVLCKNFEAELVKVYRDGEEKMKRLRAEDKEAEDRLKAELRREVNRSECSMSSFSFCGSEKDNEKLRKELQDAKEAKKKLEETVKRLQENARNHCSELRKIHEEHEGQLSKICKANKMEALRMMDELRLKERAIDTLEKKLSLQTAKLKNQEKGGADAALREDLTRKKSNRTVRRGAPVEADSLSRCSSTASSQGGRSRYGRTGEKEIGETSNAVTEQEKIMKEEEERQKNDQTKSEEIESLRRQLEDERKKVRLLQEEKEVANELLADPVVVWSPKRESCMKVSELPTVPEQTSEDESPARPGVPHQLEEPPPPSRDDSRWDQSVENLLGSQYHSFSQDSLDCQSQKSLVGLEGNTFPDLQLELGRYLVPSKKGDGSNHMWWWDRLSELERENGVLKTELQEAHDHVELLEFRILEMTEIEDKLSVSDSALLTCDQSTLTTLEDEGHPTSLNDDLLSLPLSVDSGLDLSGDFKAKVLEGRAWLSQLSRTSRDTEQPAVHHLAALLQWLSCHPPSPYNGQAPASPTLVYPPKMAVERDISLLAARLQESLADPSSQEETLIETISKLRSLDSSLGILQERVSTLTEENRELREALSTLSEAHETRTEASGTESELVHRKTPSLHSDLSDSESDGAEASRLPKGIETSSSFQESGIFDASCSEFLNSSTQTDVESDEYLKASLDDEKVSITKLEFDAIVSNERYLQQELSHLRCEKEQMHLENEALKTKILSLKNRSASDTEEVLRSEIRLLTQRLELSERSRREFFEEKCELEEAENDARLLAQRLESQLEAAREMESLLSASLSQEQEISREFHRQIKDLQVLEKERRSRLEYFESGGRKAERKISSLTQAHASLLQQLSFVAFGLLLVEAWKHMERVSKYALVPYKGHKLSYPQVPALDDSCCASEPMCVDAVDKIDVYVQTNESDDLSSVACQTERCLSDGATKDVSICCTISEFEPEFLVDIEPCPMTSSQATMTDSSNELSEREKFYLEQIELLQKQTISLRKDQEVEKLESLQEYMELKTSVKTLKDKLDEAEKDKCGLAFQLEDVEDERDSARRALKERIEQLKDDMSRYSDLHELEKKSLQKDYEIKLSQVRETRAKQEERILDLERQLLSLRHELETFGAAIASDLAEYDSSMESAGPGKGHQVLRAGNEGLLLEKVRNLVKSELSLRHKISDLEKKESAYRETIQEADKIMSSHVTSYTRRIEELEANVEKKNLKIKQLEGSEDRLRIALKNNPRGADGTRISELLDRLIQTENSELKLKEEVWCLERNEKELQIKLVEAEKVNQCLRAELRDQEELLQRLMSLESENNALSLELQQAHEMTRRLGEVQMNENLLRGRVDELEMSENVLRETLHQADLVLAQREKKLRDQVGSLTDELHSCKLQLEAANYKEIQSHEIEMNLRRQLEDAKQRLQEAEKEIQESSTESLSNESQYRTEVSKLRNQLKLANSQLTDLDSLNCSLRDKITTLETAVECLTLQLEDRMRRHEQDLLHLNLQLSQRDGQLNDVEGQLDQLRHSNDACEFNALTSEPVTVLHRSVLTLIENLQGCEQCSSNLENLTTETKAQLESLSSIIHGCVAVSDFAPCPDVNGGKPDTCSAENLANDHLTTPPPSPAGEGLREHSDGEFTFLEEESFSKGTEGTQLLQRTSMRKTVLLEEHLPLRSPLLQGSTILEELEEKVRELEEAMSSKEEELRLADTEARELQAKLQSRERLMERKDEEIQQLRLMTNSLREQLLQTIEDCERSKLSLDAKHKVDIEKLTEAVSELTTKVEEVTRSARLKDSIISTLVFQIRAILRSGNMAVIVTQLKGLKNEVKSEEEEETSVIATVPDFDVDTVCHLLTEKNED